MRFRYHSASLSPASIAPSVRMIRVTTAVNVGQVNETFCGSVENASFCVFTGGCKRSRDTICSIQGTDDRTEMRNPFDKQIQRQNWEIQMQRRVIMST